VPSGYGDRNGAELARAGAAMCESCRSGAADGVGPVEVAVARVVGLSEAALAVRRGEIARRLADPNLPGGDRFLLRMEQEAIRFLLDDRRAGDDRRAVDRR
jgi:hypothetical protein